MRLRRAAAAIAAIALTPFVATGTATAAEPGPATVRGSAAEPGPTTKTSPAAETATSSLGTAPEAVPTTSVAAAGTPWSTRHGAASARGTATTSVTGATLRTLRVDGTLTNAGSGCVSVWVLAQHDLAGIPRRQVEQCGAGSTPIRATFQLMPTSSISLRVCEGEGLERCSPFVRL